MTTPEGIAHCIKRIGNRQTKGDLAKLRANLGVDYVNHPAVKTALLVKEKELTR